MIRGGSLLWSGREYQPKGDVCQVGVLWCPRLESNPHRVFLRDSRDRERRVAATCHIVFLHVSGIASTMGQHS